MTVAEPPRPERGRTSEELAAERGPDVSPEQQAVADAQGWPRRLAAAADPRFLLSQAQGYPVGIKQFLQLCLILVYPAWLFVVLIAWPVWLVCTLVERVGYGVLYVLFWPVRAIHKKNNPEEYAAFQAELKAREQAGKQGR